MRIRGSAVFSGSGANPRIRGSAVFSGSVCGSVGPDPLNVTHNLLVFQPNRQPRPRRELLCTQELKIPKINQKQDLQDRSPHPEMTFKPIQFSKGPKTVIFKFLPRGIHVTPVHFPLGYFQKSANTNNRQITDEHYFRGRLHNSPLRGQLSCRSENTMTRNVRESLGRKGWDSLGGKGLMICPVRPGISNSSSFKSNHNHMRARACLCASLATTPHHQLAGYVEYAVTRVPRILLKHTSRAPTTL